MLKVFVLNALKHRPPKALKKRSVPLCVCVWVYIHVFVLDNDDLVPVNPMTTCDYKPFFSLTLSPLLLILISCGYAALMASLCLQVFVSLIQAH